MAGALITWSLLLLASVLLTANCQGDFNSTDECLIVTLSSVPDNSTDTCPNKGSHSQNVVVNVSQGSLRGRKVCSRKSGCEFYSFQGIPYARPPVGNLRFQAPRAPLSWTGIRDATAEGPTCPQYDNGPIRGSEDCLFVNVYTPQLPSGRNPTRLAVMVWIHGGGHFGSGNSVIYGPDYLVDKNVVVVTLNYRVGVLGFLGINSSQVSINNGLKDQVAALKWVQANIAQFGGDKDRVTIFGQSYGASCLELLTLSPATTGLFHRAISQSGNGIDRWAYIEPSRARARALILGQSLGLNTQNVDELAAFLKNATIEDLLNNQDSAFTPEDIVQNADIAFLPTWEGGATGSGSVVLPNDPVAIMKSGTYQHVPYLTGFASDEPKAAYIAFLSNQTLWDLLSQSFEQFIPPQLRVPLNTSASRALAAEIRQLYFGNGTLTPQDTRDLVTLVTDGWFAEGVRRSAQFRLRTSTSPVYIYQFSYVGNLSISQFCNYGYPYRGAAHSDDLSYLFNIHRLTTRPSARDITTRDRMTTMWTNFAKTGNPNAHNLQVTWEPYTNSSQKYLDIDVQLRIRSLRNLRPDKFAFWDRLYAPLDG